jgi:hypothetical protein
MSSQFSAHVKAAFKGVLSSGIFDPSIDETEQYRTFHAGMQTSVDVRGGHRGLATSLTLDPTDLNLYRDWVLGHHLQEADLMSFQTQAIWNLMRTANDPDTAKAAQHVQDAYAYIVTHPAIHITHVQFSISAGWGTFGLLSPEAILAVDPAVKKACPGQVTMETKTVRWGHDHPYVALVR